jgi:hypothetical protein
MTGPRPSPCVMLAGRPHRRRMAGFVRLRPPTQTSQLTTSRSPRLQRPHGSVRGTGEARVPADIVIAIRQPHQFGRSASSTNVKSP